MKAHRTDRLLRTVKLVLRPGMRKHVEAGSKGLLPVRACIIDPQYQGSMITFRQCCLVIVDGPGRLTTCCVSLVLWAFACYQLLMWRCRRTVSRLAVYDKRRTSTRRDPRILAARTPIRAYVAPVVSLIRPTSRREPNRSGSYARNLSVCCHHPKS